jgi:16S rRNA (guanine527-N7)-methyltransferase
MLPEHRLMLRDLAKSRLEIELNDLQVDQFSTYSDLLIEWNEKFNLTSITDPADIIVKHFLDSLALKKHIHGEKIADIGTGAGFPGIPLKIFYPNLQLFLVDSLAKRLEFLNVVCDCLGFKKVETVHARAEDLGRDPKYRETFDTVTSRAVARLPVLLEYALPLLKRGGHFIAAKGSLADEEIAESGKALTVLGGKVYKVARFNLGSEAEHRSIVDIEKVSNTPKSYPRKAGTPAKQPLI